MFYGRTAKFLISIYESMQLDLSSHILFRFTFRYVSGSTKEVTHWKREKGASRVFRLKSTSRLPARSLLFSMTSNKTQIINMIIQDFLDHKDDPVPHRLIITGPDPIPVELPTPAIDNDSGQVIYRQDLKTTQEEAETIIVQQVINSWWFI